MRRISLALALLGAVAAAGCGGGTNPSSSGSGKGIPGSTFTVSVRQPTGGTVRSGNINTSGAFVLDNRIVCGTAGSACTADFAWDPALAVSIVALQATADAGKIIEGWAGDCQGGDALCVLSGKADKYVLVRFNSPDLVTSHPNWSPTVVTSVLHVNAARTFALMCNRCHGVEWTGQAIAPSCNLCHSVNALAVWEPAFSTTPQGKHFDPAGFTGHNSPGCARCHQGLGFRDYLGADGTPANYLTFQYRTGTGQVDATANFTAAPFTCNTCHNAVSDPYQGVLGQKKFASGKIVTTDAVTALCSQCHDGGRPGYEVAALNYALDPLNSATTNPDGQVAAAVNKVVRAHYLPAAATLFGEDGAAWFQYSGNAYTARNDHGGKASCTSCHDPHTGELPADSQIAAKCGVCHFNETTGLPVATFLELEDARQYGFEGDIDGDTVQESLKLEIEGLGAKLFTAIRTYATNVAGASICIADNKAYYDNGTGGGTANNGTCETGEIASANEYKMFTQRLLKAVYNYMLFQNDAGGWAHNPRYEIEVIYDTIADLNVGLGANFVANGVRAFDGHFGAAEDPSEYAAMIYHGGSNKLTGEVLPVMGFTSGACYQCHGGKGGFDAYLAAAPVALTSAVINDANKVTALQCSTCHTWGANMRGIRSDVAKVYFPPQKALVATPTNAVVSFDAANLPTTFTVCGTCHSGRENGQSITNKIGTKAPTSWSLSFTNPHYLGAAGMMLGDNAKVMYQYAGKSYTKNPAFWAAGTKGGAPGPHGSPHGAECTGCHQAKASKHTFEVDLTYCAGCHAGAYALAPIEDEYVEAATSLYGQIRTYAAANLSAIQTAVNGQTITDPVTLATTALVGSTVTNICYNGAANPYFFIEVAGVCQDGVANAPALSLSFGKFNSTLLKAAYNYQWTQKEPGAWAHNEFYVLQVIYDSIVDLGGTPSFTVAASTRAPIDPTVNRP